MSFLKKLFGGGGSDGGAPAAATAEAEIDGFVVRATPQKDGGQFRLCGVITKTVDGEDKEHILIRADLFPSADEASEATLRKARQVIKEQGEGLFR